MIRILRSVGSNDGCVYQSEIDDSAGADTLDCSATTGKSITADLSKTTAQTVNSRHQVGMASPGTGPALGSSGKPSFGFGTRHSGTTTFMPFRLGGLLVDDLLQYLSVSYSNATPNGKSRSTHRYVIATADLHRCDRPETLRDRDTCS